jgi:hypothetical protein
MFRQGTHPAVHLALKMPCSDTSRRSARTTLYSATPAFVHVWSKWLQQSRQTFSSCASQNSTVSRLYRIAIENSINHQLNMGSKLTMIIWYMISWQNIAIPAGREFVRATGSSTTRGTRQPLIVITIHTYYYLIVSFGRQSSGTSCSMCRNGKWPNDVCASSGSIQRGVMVRDKCQHHHHHHSSGITHTYLSQQGLLILYIAYAYRVSLKTFITSRLLLFATNIGFMETRRHH